MGFQRLQRVGSRIKQPGVSSTEITTAAGFALRVITTVSARYWTRSSSAEKPFLASLLSIVGSLLNSMI
jgi:hypothetical protein